MVSLILGSFGLVYLVSAPCFFSNWFEFFQKEADHLSPEEKQMSIATLVTASVLWPVVVPLAYMEKMSKAKQTTQLQKQLGQTNTASAEGGC